MDRGFLTPAAPADAAAVTEVVASLESSLYGETVFSQADLEEEWSELDRERDTRVVRDGDRVVGYGAVRERGELWRVEGYVHPDELGRGIGTMIATGPRRRRSAPALAGSTTRSWSATPPREHCSSRWGTAPSGSSASCASSSIRSRRHPSGRRGCASSPSTRSATRASSTPRTRRRSPIPGNPRRATSSHGQRRTSRASASIRRSGASSRAGDEIAAGTICTGDTYGGGWVHTLFTRRPWRKQGVGSALLGDAFRRLWERGERSVGLGADTASDTGAFRLYERAGMTPMLGWAVYEKELGDPGR